MSLGEDWKVCKCLQSVGCEIQDTRDAAGRERFIVYNPDVLILGHGVPGWYHKYDAHGALMVSEWGTGGE